MWTRLLDLERFHGRLARSFGPAPGARPSRVSEDARVDFTLRSGQRCEAWRPDRVEIARRLDRVGGSFRLAARATWGAKLVRSRRLAIGLWSRSGWSMIT
jgi:hypothetical protein